MRTRPRLTLCSAVLLVACTTGADPASDDPAAGDSDGVSSDGRDSTAAGDDGPGQDDGTDGAQSDDGADGPSSDGAGDGGDGTVEGDAGAGDDGAGDGSAIEGVITPSATDTVQVTRDFYDTWTERYLEPACKDGQLRVHSAPATAAYTVSEAHGYGMLFTAMMAEHDPEAQARFDGLYRYFVDHPSSLTPGLMAWAQDADCKNVMGSDAATDGDLDIAYSLLVADQAWGSAGAIDYRSEALRVIAAVLDGEVADDDHLLIGDWAAGDSHADGTRASDFLPQHFKAYGQASGTARWGNVVDKLYAIVSDVQQNESASTGLLPDFIVDADTQDPKPAPADWLEGDHDGHYHYNACRVPWRIGTDYVITGDGRARAAMRKLNAFIRQKTADDPSKIVDGFELDGDAYGASDELAFVAPFAVSAMIEPEAGTNQAWLDALWQHITSNDDGGYYGDSIKLATMLVVSRQWKSP